MILILIIMYINNYVYKNVLIIFIEIFLLDDTELRYEIALYPNKIGNQ